MRRTITGLATLAWALGSAPSGAQQPSMRDRLAGAWTFVSAVSETAEGKRTEPFGSNPIGIIIFSPDGHFSLFQSRSELPKMAANDRGKATAEEAQTIMEGSISYSGTYLVDDAQTITVKLEGSSFPNLVSGAPQKRIITSLTTEELKFTNPRTPAGLTLYTVWKRTQP